MSREDDVINRLDEIRAVLERIAVAVEGPTAEDRLAAYYERSKIELQKQRSKVELQKQARLAAAYPRHRPPDVVGRTMPPQRVDPDRPRS